MADAQAAADSVRLVIEGNRVRTTSVDGDRVRNWSVQLIVSAPDGSSIDAQTSNGPIGVSGATGTFFDGIRRGRQWPRRKPVTLAM